MYNIKVYIYYIYIYIVVYIYVDNFDVSDFLCTFGIKE
jgi:hypothetical protein